MDGNKNLFGKLDPDLQLENLNKSTIVPNVIEVTNYEKEKLKVEQKNIESSEEKDIKITLARLRYRQKSSLWKFFHKKSTPERLNFNNMSNDEIDNLYRRR